jgi:anti-anti-sigma factor
MEPEAVAQLILDSENREAKIVVKASAVDVQLVAPIERLLDEVATAGVERLEIDLGTVSFADSSVVRLALKARERLAPRGAKVVIKAPSAVSRLFELTETDGLFEFVPAH